MHRVLIASTDDAFSRQVCGVLDGRVETVVETTLNGFGCRSVDEQFDAVIVTANGFGPEHSGIQLAVIAASNGLPVLMHSNEPNDLIGQLMQRRFQGNIAFFSSHHELPGCFETMLWQYRRSTSGRRVLARS